jgi:hypothetical protein
METYNEWTSESGQVVTLFHDRAIEQYYVRVNGANVHTTDSYESARRVVQWWLDGCPA